MENLKMRPGAESSANSIYAKHNSNRAIPIGSDVTLRGRFVDRQRKKEHCAMGCVRCRREATAMCLDDRATDRQADAKPLCLGRIKGLKQVKRMLRIQSRPR